jgi:hypothetical protein
MGLSYKNCLTVVQDRQKSVGIVVRNAAAVLLGVEGAQIIGAEARPGALLKMRDIKIIGRLRRARLHDGLRPGA